MGRHSTSIASSTTSALHAVADDTYTKTTEGLCSLALSDKNGCQSCSKKGCETMRHFVLSAGIVMNDNTSGLYVISENAFGR
jgi:hypothetical protein